MGDCDDDRQVKLLTRRNRRLEKIELLLKPLLSLVFFPFNLFRMRQREENRAKFATRWKEGEKKKAAEVIMMMMMKDSGDDIDDGVNED